MNTQEKSLALAELMGWNYAKDSGYLRPYDDSVEGRAQFAAILLKFPEVVMQFTQCGCDGWFDEFKPTQVNILDEILRMEGKL